MPRRLPIARTGTILLLVAATAAAWILGTFGSGPGPAHADADAGTTGAVFRRAEGERVWVFPRDHGRHPDYRLEWWYYTGILRDGEGRPFGFQVTFFRRGLVPRPPRRDSAWASGSLYAAQVALSDVTGGRFLHGGRSGRDGLGIAGAAPDRQRVWLGDWGVEPLPPQEADGDKAGADTGNAAGHDVRIRAATADFTLDLEMRARREPVLHGRGGLDAKGEYPGQASWYYSLTRLDVTGEIAIAGERIPVRGRAWMDHEFGTSQMGADLVGWDWFGLRLDDGSDLMLYRLRRRDGSLEPASGGSWVSPEGIRRAVSLDPGRGAVVEPLRWWRSPGGEARYPVAWRIDLPELGLQLETTPLLDRQEMLPTPGIPFAYWEGAVRVAGFRDGKPVTGEGYQELTGYGGSIDPVFR